MLTADILLKLRKMNHLIEVDEEELPRLEGNRKWLYGWTRFHDVMTNALICVNGNDRPYNIQKTEYILICSPGFYDKGISISDKTLEKFLLAEEMKSKMLGNHFVKNKL